MTRDFLLATVTAHVANGKSLNAIQAAMPGHAREAVWAYHLVRGQFPVTPHNKVTLIQSHSKPAKQPRAKQPGPNAWARKMTPETRAAIAAAYEGGRSLTDTAARFGVGLKSVRDVLVLNGVGVRPGHGQHSPGRQPLGAVKARLPEIMALRERGLTLAAIAIETGLKLSSINNLLCRDAKGRGAGQ